MSYNNQGYQQPHDPYMHSNASQYDNRYQQGYQQDQGYQGYSDDHNGGYSDYPPQPQGSYSPHSDGHYGKEGAGVAGAGAAAGYGAGTGYNPAQQSGQSYSQPPPKKGKSKWIKWGIPALILLILIAVGAALGGYFGSKSSKSSSSSSSSSSPVSDTSSFSGLSIGSETSNYSSSVLSAASSAASAGGKDQLTFKGTDLYGNPAYISAATTASATNGSAAVSCSDSTVLSGDLSSTALRSHPRIMSTQGQWDCMTDKIQNDAYLTIWNASIFQNASAFYSMTPTNYSIDGTFTGSGILDPAREVQLRLKTWGYAYRMTNDTKWVDRAWTELQVAAGNSTEYPWNCTQVDSSLPRNQTWNPAHFLDTGELTAAFAIAYDWMYDAWSTKQRTAIMWSILELGLRQGVAQYASASLGWWQNVNGNWNCVCGSGLLLGALAIWDVDPTGYASSIIASAIPNLKENCMQSVYDDGTWSETANYWYFGSNAQARAVSALITSTGNDQGLSAANTNWNQTGLFHMYIGGPAGLYDYGDNGPNKYSTNANGMFLWSWLYDIPSYALYQRDRADAADPLSMLWYPTTVSGAWWNGLALDKFFNNELGSWASMRSSWTDYTGTYVAMKSSNSTGHQTHGDLDMGDFVIDALGTRFAGDLGNGNYLSYEYFTSEAQDADRWQYYRKGTQGQNTLTINLANAEASCQPTNTFETTGAAQSNSFDYVPGVDDVAYFKTDMSTCYNTSTGTVQRGIRYLNGRRQILVQDEITSTSSITSVQWRVHTNGTVTLSSDGKTATLVVSNLTDPNAWGGASPLYTELPSERTMVVSLLSGGVFTTQAADRIYGTQPSQAQNTFGTDEQGDQPNPGVTVLTVDLEGASGTIETWWQPQYPNLNSTDKTQPPSVALADWSLTSHNQ